MSLADVLRGIAGMLDSAKNAEREAVSTRCRICRALIDPHFNNVDGNGTAAHPRVIDCPLSGRDIPISECERTP